MARKKLSKDEIEAKAINIVQTEQQNWEDAVVYVTDKVGFRMRELIKRCRKLYWGVFDEPIDRATGLEKIFIGLPMAIVEDVFKNIDLDTKDITFRAKVPEGDAITELTRGLVKDYLDRSYFGESLDELERALAIDGTVVWKTWEEGKFLRKAQVDLLNVYIDPTEQSIQTAYRFTERCLYTPDQLEGMDGWLNTKAPKGSTSLNRNDSGRTQTSTTNTTGSFVDVWETWGKIPLGLITAKIEDMNTEVDGHIVVSGIQSGDPRLQLVERNTKKDNDGNIIKPYEECRVAKITGRWYGLGYVERIMALAEYLNTVVNMRINRARVSQLGLFKIRKGSGITPQMLAKLPSNGAISVTQMDDIEQFDINGPDQTSYKDEEVIQTWSTRVTQAFPITSGETMPASATATSAAISNNNSKNGFSPVKDAIGFFLERWMDRHALPIIAKSVKAGDIVRILGDDKLDELTEKIVATYAHEILNGMVEKGLYPSKDGVQQAINDAKEQVLSRKALFFNIVEELMTNQLETKVAVTNETMDTGVSIQNLLTTLQLAPEYKDDTISEIYNLMGLRKPKINKEMADAQLMAMQGKASPTGIPNESPTSLVTKANTLNG